MSVNILDNGELKSIDSAAVVDNFLSTVSKNPVQNKVITENLNNNTTNLNNHITNLIFSSEGSHGIRRNPSGDGSSLDIYNPNTESWDSFSGGGANPSLTILSHISDPDFTMAYTTDNYPVGELIMSEDLTGKGFYIWHGTLTWWYADGVTPPSQLPLRIVIDNHPNYDIFGSGDVSTISNTSNYNRIILSSTEISSDATQYSGTRYFTDYPILLIFSHKIKINCSGAGTLKAGYGYAFNYGNLMKVTF